MATGRTALAFAAIGDGADHYRDFVERTEDDQGAHGETTTWGGAIKAWWKLRKWSGAAALKAAGYETRMNLIPVRDSGQIDVFFQPPLPNDGEAAKLAHALVTWATSQNPLRREPNPQRLAPSAFEQQS